MHPLSAKFEAAREWRAHCRQRCQPVGKPMQRRKIWADDVVNRVCEYFGTTHDKIMSRESRARDVVRPRQVAMFIIREELNRSFPWIAAYFGGFDHSTVKSAVERIREVRRIDAELSDDIDKVCQALINGW